MILCLSGEQDGHIAFVTKHLDADDFTRIDVEDIIAGRELSYSFRNGSAVVNYNGRQLTGVTGVWYRRPHVADEVEIPVRKQHRAFSAQSLQTHVNILRGLFRDACWLSNPYAIRRADNKVLQLELAYQLGFNIPETLFTSSPAAAKAFVNQHKATIAKRQSSEFFYQKDGTLSVFYTSYVQANLPDADGLRVAPAIFQEAVTAATELRITVVGKRVFAASVHSKATLPAHVRDWRAAQVGGSVAYRAFDLPRSIAEKCIKHCQELGLNFGAMDIIIDSAGKYWFIENNPNGQWAFIEQATGQPIGRTIAELLQGTAEPLVRYSKPGVY